METLILLFSHEQVQSTLMPIFPQPFPFIELICKVFRVGGVICTRVEVMCRTHTKGLLLTIVQVLLTRALLTEGMLRRQALLRIKGCYMSKARDLCVGCKSDEMCEKKCSLSHSSIVSKVKWWTSQLYAESVNVHVHSHLSENHW